jgi:hypothetical protein
LVIRFLSVGKCVLLREQEVSGKHSSSHLAAIRFATEQNGKAPAYSAASRQSVLIFGNMSHTHHRGGCLLIA